MAPAKHTIHIRRPVEDVVSVLTNVEYERGWERGVANLKRMMEAGEL